MGVGGRAGVGAERLRAVGRARLLDPSKSSLGPGPGLGLGLGVGVRVRPRARARARAARASRGWFARSERGHAREAWGQSRSKTLKAPLTRAGVYAAFTLRDITVTNSAGSTAGKAGREEGRAAAVSTGAEVVGYSRMRRGMVRRTGGAPSKSISPLLSVSISATIWLSSSCARGAALRVSTRWRCGGQKESAPCSPDSA